MTVNPIYHQHYCVSMSSSEGDGGSAVSGSNQNDWILEPLEDDVLCGRGRKTRLHPGNKFYLSLIQSKVEEYSDAPKGLKMEISNEVVSCIRNKKNGGRFLQQVGSGSYWIDIGEQKARGKVAQALRDFKKVQSSPFAIHGKHNVAKKIPNKEEGGIGMKFKLFQRRRTDDVDDTSDSSSEESEEEDNEVEELSSSSEEGSDDDDQLSSSSEEEEEKEDQSSDEEDNDAGAWATKGYDNASETETEDSFPAYHRRGK